MSREWNGVAYPLSPSGIFDRDFFQMKIVSNGNCLKQQDQHAGKRTQSQQNLASARWEGAQP